MSVPNGYYRGAGGWLYLWADDSGPYCVDAQGNIMPAAYSGISVVANKWVPFSGLSLLTEQALWTPAAGLKFRLMGYQITSTIVGGNVNLHDGVGGTVLLTLGFGLVNQSLDDRLGNGILSGGVNNKLTATGAITQVLSGYVYGREE